MIGTSRLVAAIAVFGCFGLSPAFADAIDGAWCSDKGRRFMIEGPKITITKGTSLTGNYTRHTFGFVLPSGEPDAGSAVDMLLQGETRVRVTIGATAPQIWLRCPPDIS